MRKRAQNELERKRESERTRAVLREREKEHARVKEKKLFMSTRKLATTTTTVEA